MGALAEHGYRRELRYHTIGEPLCDPRLVSMIEEANRALAGVRIVLWSNGLFLSQQLCDELCEAGMTTLITTAYGAAEEKRQRELALPVPHRVVVHRGFDEALLGQYDAEPTGSTDPCYAPLKRLSIGVDGSVVLCCRDWQKRYTFGSLREERLVDIVRSEAVWRTYDRLRRGQRTLGLCKRCRRIR